MPEDRPGSGDTPEPRRCQGVSQFGPGLTNAEPGGLVGGGILVRAAGGHRRLELDWALRAASENRPTVMSTLLVADDVDHLRGELVKLKATVNCHVPSARQGSVLVAVAAADLVLGESVRSATGSGR